VSRAEQVEAAKRAEAAKRDEAVKAAEAAKKVADATKAEAAKEAEVVKRVAAVKRTEVVKRAAAAKEAEVVKATKEAEDAEEACIIARKRAADEINIVARIAPLEYIQMYLKPGNRAQRADVSYFSQYSTLPHLEIGSIIPSEVYHFQSLARDIISAHGNVHKFALDTKAEYFDWMRVAATRTVRLLLHRDTILPSFERKNLSIFSSVLSGVAPEKFPYDLISVDVLYRVFFLDYALPHCAYLYAKDLRAERADFGRPEIEYTKSIDYYSFIATITYLGSLLLMAAEGYSRVLYEGVRWMLLRTYCILDILDWDSETVYDKSFLVSPDELLHSAIKPNPRFSTKDTLGDSYAQHGWELFKNRPHALNYLASITQIAFFNDNRRNTDDYTTAHNDNSLQSFCRKAGYVVYKAECLRRMVGLSVYKKKDLKQFCTTELKENRVFYPVSTAEKDAADVIHELYFIFDILRVFACDRNAKSPYMIQAEKKKLTFSSELEGPKVLSLDFPLPPEFGFEFIPKANVYRFDLVAYFSVRYAMTFNRLILNTILYTFYSQSGVSSEGTDTSINTLRERIQRLSSAQEEVARIPDMLNPNQELTYEAVFYSHTLKAELSQKQSILLSEIINKLLHFDEFYPTPPAFEAYVDTASFRNPLKSWEFCFPVVALSSCADSIRSDFKLLNPKLNTKKIPLEEPKIIPPPLATASHPEVMFFAISLFHLGYSTMFVSRAHNMFYVGFSGMLQNTVESLISIEQTLALQQKKYKAYPYTFLPISCFNDSTFISAFNRLTDIYNLQSIRYILESSYSQLNNFTLACLLPKTPSDLRQLQGFISAKEYLDYCSTIPMDPVVMHRIASIYSVRLPESIYKKALELNSIEHVPKYTPHFSEEDDLLICKHYSPNMTLKDKEIILRSCVNHSWPAIKTRARKLAKKMLEEERVFNINILPVRNYTAKTKELLERNFNAALNVDPRLKVDDTKKTEAALRKKYLTPRPRRPL
jgi:hypothetical protein